MICGDASLHLFSVQHASTHVSNVSKLTVHLPLLLLLLLSSSSGRKCEKRLLAWMKGIVQDLRNHEAAWPFKEPVNPDIAPDYYQVVEEPMDLKTLGRNVNDNKYIRLEEFVADCTKIFDNCRFYNEEDTLYYSEANRLQEYFERRMSEARAHVR
ncbi:hypothetical protein PTSG_12911, partial [Salpingoeca rosetta]